MLCGDVAWMIFMLQFIPSQHLVSMYKLADYKPVQKYKWSRIETIRVTQEAT